MPEKVSIVNCFGEDHVSLTKAVAHAMDLLDSPLSNIRSGSRVVIKPNITAQDISWRQGVVTNPNLVRAIIEVVQQYNPGEILIAEAIAIGLDVKKAFSFLGYDKVAQETGAKLVDLYDEEFARFSIPKGKLHHSMEISKTVMGADYLIIVPVMKTHVATEISVCMKCLMGTISVEQKKKFHFSGLWQSIIDLNLAVGPDLFIVDGTVAGEGDGPMANKPVGLDKLIAGTNPRAVDMVAARVMGFEPEETALLGMAAECWGPLPESEIQILGEPLEKTIKPFKRATNSVAAREGITYINGNACAACAGVIELALRRAERMEALDKSRPLRILFGPDAAMPQGEGANLVVGRCLSHLKDTGYFVPGCPPQVFLISDEIGEMAGCERGFGCKEDYMFCDTDFISHSSRYHPTS